MILDPGTTWGDIQDTLDDWDEPLNGPTSFFGMTRDEIMSYPTDELVFPEYDDNYDEEDEDVPTD